MKINDHEVLKFIKPQSGDMFIRVGYGVETGKEDVRIYTPFYTAFKFFALDKDKNTVLFAAYHSDEFGFIEYADVSEGTVLNYKQYKKTMKLIGKEPLPFTQYMLSVVNGENGDTVLWEDQITK